MEIGGQTSILDRKYKARRNVDNKTLRKQRDLYKMEYLCIRYACCEYCTFVCVHAFTLSSSCCGMEWIGYVLMDVFVKLTKQCTKDEENSLF